jgi:hypothetical protein
MPATFFAIAALRATWRQLRKEVRQARIRDAVDWLDWSVGLDRSLVELHGELVTGVYHPAPPSRFEAPKAAGSYRVVTVPHIRDALVYRHIADSILGRLITRKVKGAYFSRSHAATPIGKTFDVTEDPSLSVIEIWLRYNEYRTHTLLNQPYRVLVVTDITNYFDSIPHDLLIEHLAPAGLPREAVGILGKLLEALRPTAGHSCAPRIGLAVDEYDCSRQLAHVFLFAHDRRVVAKVGEDNYVRWMDDQNVGVDSHPLARRVVNLLTRSLAEQRLTLNAGKTKFLTPPQVAAHFQLEANQLLTDWHDAFQRGKKKVTPAIIARFRALWKRIQARPEAREGNWDKILKRVFGMAGELGIPDLEALAPETLVQYPSLAERVFTYYARRNRASQLLILYRNYLHAGENLYEFLEAQFFEAALLLSPSTPVRNALRVLAERFATGAHSRQTGRPLGRANAILCLYWFGTPGKQLSSLFDQSAARALPKEVARTWLACCTARSPKAIDPILHLLIGNAGDDVARLARFLIAVVTSRLATIGAYYHRRARWPSKGYCYDARAWLVFELCSHSKEPRMRASTRTALKHFTSLAVTWPELAIRSRAAAA